MYAARTAAAHPDKPAIVMVGTGETVTFASYEAEANRIAHMLRDQGLRRGDHIAILSSNNPVMLEIEGAADRAGLYYTLINSYLGPDEVAYIVGNCKAKTFFASPDKLDVARQAATSCRAVEQFVVTGGEVADGVWEPLASMVASYPSTPIADECLGAAMLYSSGTTGQPKGIHRALPEVPPGEALPVMEFVRYLFGFTEDMTYLNPAPLYHSAPQASVAATLRLGATAVVMEHFDPEGWMAAVQRYRRTHCQMVPTMFNRLLRVAEDARNRYDLSSLQRIVHAAAPCPIPIKQAMIDWLGPIITEYYGATEANGFTFCDSAEWLAHPGTVGRAVLGEVVIRDENGLDCPPGTDGTVWFRGATNFEYFEDAEKTAESRAEDGNMSTVGDIGHLDADGWLFLTDRKSYMIISGGVNIYPQETENLLSTHPGVSDVAVIGAPDPDMGEKVVAVVEPAPGYQAGADLARELINFSRQHLAHFKCPKQVDFVSELPRLPTGKLYKRLVRDRYWAQDTGSSA